MTNVEKEKSATDMEVAVFLTKHIHEPCEDLNGNNIRNFYIREAEKVLQTIKDPEAKKLLEDTIQQYSN